MTILIILSAISFLLLLAYVSPKLARKIFPAPSSDSMTFNVYFHHGLEVGQHIKVENELLEVTNVNGGQITVKQVA